MFLGGAAAGAAGFGMGMVALPFMLLVLDPVTAVLALNTTQVLLFLMILRGTRSQVQTGEAKPMALLGLAGAVVGVFALTATAEAAIRLTAVSVILLLSVITAAARTHSFRVPSRVGPPLGFAAAFLLGAMAIGGPVMAIYALGRGWAKNSVRGTLALY
ncbi:MAG: TSUP family transporter, partial [Dehalococcoidia bacterium]|nr:TSUP family transporter [Dehalococcoidia bacterium]